MGKERLEWKVLKGPVILCLVQVIKTVLDTSTWWLYRLYKPIDPVQECQVVWFSAVEYSGVDIPAYALERVYLLSFVSFVLLSLGGA